MWDGVDPGDIHSLPKDQKSDLLTSILKELVSVTVALHTISRNLERPGQRSSAPQGTVALDAMFQGLGSVPLNYSLMLCHIVH